MRRYRARHGEGEILVVAVVAVVEVVVVRCWMKQVLLSWLVEESHMSLMKGVYGYLLWKMKKRISEIFL